MFTIVFNPETGTKRTLHVLDEVKTILDSQSISYTTFNIIDHIDEPAYSSIPSGSQDTVCILGGDGTVLRTFNKLNGDSFRLMIVPCGTGNDFIKSLGLPKDPIKAFNAQINGTVRHIDYLLANNRRFLNVMGAGFDVDVLTKLNAFKHKFSGLKSYLMAVIHAVRGYSPIELEISQDGSPFSKRQLSLISIGNGSYIGGGMKAVPGAITHDGIIDVVEVKAVKRWQLLFLLPLFILGLHVKFGLGKAYSCKKISIISKNMDYQLDGEIFNDESVSVNIISGRLQAFDKSSR